MKFYIFREILLNEDKSMYERYAALFALRNLGREEAVSAIVESLGANSALLRHEVCLCFLVNVYWGCLSVFICGLEEKIN